MRGLSAFTTQRIAAGSSSTGDLSPVRGSARLDGTAPGGRGWAQPVADHGAPEPRAPRNRSMAARWRARLSRQVFFFVLPFGSTVVVGGSGRSEGAPVLGGDVSFFGFLTIFSRRCSPMSVPCV